MGVWACGPGLLLPRGTWIWGGYAKLPDWGVDEAHALAASPGTGWRICLLIWGAFYGVFSLRLDSESQSLSHVRIRAQIFSIGNSSPGTPAAEQDLITRRIWILTGPMRLGFLSLLSISKLAISRKANTWLLPLCSDIGELRCLS